MLTVWMTKGLPASGKTTWARAKMEELPPGSIKRVNKDLLREMLDFGQWGRGNEKVVLAARDALIVEALDRGKHVIVDDTNLAPRHEARIRQLIKGKAKLEIVDFTDTDPWECIERDSKRPNPVGRAVILRMYRQFVQPEYVRGQGANNPLLPECIIVDIDGTLAIMADRDPYDGSRAMEDKLNMPVARIVHMLKASHANLTVIVVTGRDGVYRQVTEDWLNAKAVPFDELYTRAEGDRRKDAEVKREIWKRHVQRRFSVLAVLDDRDQVVDMWRSLGLTCLQVNYGDF